MKIRALIERGNRKETVRFGGRSVGGLLRALHINPESVIVARGGDLLAACRPLREGEEVRIIHIKASD